MRASAQTFVVYAVRSIWYELYDIGYFRGFVAGLDDFF